MGSPRPVLWDCLLRGLVYGAVMEVVAQVTAHFLGGKVLLVGYVLGFAWSIHAGWYYGWRRDRSSGARGAARAAIFLTAFFGGVWALILATQRPDVTWVAALAATIPGIAFWGAGRERAKREAKRHRFEDVRRSPDLRLVSPLSASEVLALIEQEADAFPSRLRALVSLNSHFWRGTSRVCGRVEGSGFELRARNGPAFSILAIGIVSAMPDGSPERAVKSAVAVRFSKPGVLLRLANPGRYERDRATILGFLRETLGARESGLPVGQRWK
jgi:hypothetical protein